LNKLANEGRIYYVRNTDKRNIGKRTQVFQKMSFFTNRNFGLNSIQSCKNPQNYAYKTDTRCNDWSEPKDYANYIDTQRWKN